MIIALGIILTALVLRRPLGISISQCLPLAFCFGVALASVFVMVLSVFHAVEPNVMRVSVIAAYSGAVLWLWRTRNSAHLSSKEPSRKWNWIEKILAGLTLSPLIVLAWLATLFPPLNWDSMTYHLSRVALWIQHQSVFPYPTTNFRQVQLTPGAEYLILVEQLFWFSDVFANWVQLVALVVVGLGVFGWCEHWKISRTTSLLLILTTLPAPMLLMQAQTTQNDLAAAVPVFTVIMLLVDRIISRHGEALTAPLSSLEAFALPISVATGHLIKPTGTLILLPVLIWFIIPTLVTIARDRKRLTMLVLASLFAGAAALPEVIIRRVTFGTISISSQHVRTELYDLGEQSFNGLRHLADHLPPEITVPAIELLAPLFGTVANVIVDTGRMFSAHEDLTGNPVQAEFYLVIFALLFCLGSGGGRVLCILALASWFLLHAVVNNQPWMSRLQTPWFVMMIGVSALAAYLRPRTVQVSLWISAMMSVNAAVILLRWCVEDRSAYFGSAPLFDRQVRYHGYFMRRRSAEIPYDQLKQTISACSTVRYISGEDDFDYPVAWLAIRNGRRFEHHTAQTAASDNCTLVALP